jgi:hypothetical protein
LCGFFPHFCCCLSSFCLLYLILLVSLDCPFLIAPYVFINVYSKEHFTVLLYSFQKCYSDLFVLIQRAQCVFFYISHDFPLYIVGEFFHSPVWYSVFSVAEHAI